MSDTRYFTGKACPYGHVCERFKSTRACVECADARKKAWSAAHPEKVNEQKRAWVAANPAVARALKAASQKRNRVSANARQQRWLAANREQSNAASAAWAQANPGKCTARSARRRAAQLQSTPAWADHDLMAAYYELARCYRDAGIEVEVDHVVPLQGEVVCGLHVHDNLQIIPTAMNRAKSNGFATL